MIAAGAEHGDARSTQEVVGVDVLATGGDDGLPDLAVLFGVFSLVCSVEGVAERVLTRWSPWLGWFAARLDHFANERDRVGV